MNIGLPISAYAEAVVGVTQSGCGVRRGAACAGAGAVGGAQ